MAEDIGVLGKTIKVDPSGWPDDSLPPNVKLSDDFGVAIGEAIWKNNRSMGHGVFYNDRVNYARNIRYALGKQGEEIYHPFMGLKPNENDKTWAKGINWAIKNYATKRINILNTKILSRQYDVSINNSDALAVDAREDMRAKLETYLDNKEVLDRLAKELGISVAPNGADPNTMPVNRMDLDLYMETDFKTISEIGMELGVKHHMSRSKYEHVRSEQAFYGTVLGPMAVYVGMDENMLPYLESVHPGELIVPYAGKPSYTDVPYIARLKWVTAQEFRKLVGNKIPETEIKQIIKEHCKKPEAGVTYNSTMLQNEDVGKLPLLHYSYRSVDIVTAKQFKDPYGNKKLQYKSRQYYDGPKGEEDFMLKYGEEKKLHKKTYNTVYEGYWLLNTKKVFCHGPRATSMRKRGAMSEDLLGYKVFVPNSWDGHVVSVGSQMIPVLDELQRYNLKLQQLVARAIPKGVGIDLYALRKAQLKWDNKDLTDQQKIEMFIRSGIFVFDSKDRYAPGSNYKPFYEVENGLTNDIEKYLGLIQNALAELDEIIGLTRPAAATTLPADAGKGTTELQIEATDIALGPLYEADKRMFQDVVEGLGMLHIKSVKYGPREYYDRIFGKMKTGVLYSEVPFHKFDYGFKVELAPTDQEWEMLYASAEKAYEKQQLPYSAVLMLREIRTMKGSIKQARRYIIMMEQKYRREQMEASGALQQQNQDTQTASIKEKLAADKDLKQFEHDLDVELEEKRQETLEMELEGQADHAERLQRLIGHQGKEEQVIEGNQAMNQLRVKSLMDRETKLAVEKAKPKPKPAAKK